MTNHHMNRYL